MQVLMAMNKEKRFNALVQGHSTTLYRYAYWLCDGHQATAEDLVQETFLRAWKALDQLQEHQAAKAWLMTILRRENARRFERKQLDIVDADLSELPLEDPRLQLDMDSHELRKAMLTLDPGYRDPLLLQILGGFSCEDIAGIMDIGKGAVMTRLFRAKKMLMSQMQEPQKDFSHG